MKRLSMLLRASVVSSVAASVLLFPFSPSLADMPYGAPTTATLRELMKHDNFAARCTDKNKDLMVHVRMEDGYASLVLMRNSVANLTPKYVGAPGRDQTTIIELAAVSGRPMQIDKNNKTLSFKGGAPGFIPGEICKVDITYER